MRTQKDKYDLAVEYLTEHPEEIQAAWGNPIRHPVGYLFTYVAETTETFCGCLTQVKSGQSEAETDALTLAIRADSRIPANEDDLNVSHLPIFAEWQRRIDEVLGRKL